MVMLGNILPVLGTLCVAFAAATPLPCAKGIHIIGARGNSTGPPRPYGLLTSTVVGLLQEFPGSTNTSVKYDRRTGDFIGPNGKGSANLLQHIQFYVNRCPKTPIVILGYSRGGIIVMNTVCGGSPNSGPVTPPLDPKYLENIIAIGLYGEQSRVPGESYNVGTCASYGALKRDNASACEPYAGIIQSWCDNADPLCCVGTGDDPAVHYQYPNEYNSALFSFVKSQYQARQKKSAR